MPINEELRKRILDYLKDKPGVKAKEIAPDLGVTKTEVNQILHSKEHKKEFIHNKNYEWFIKPGLIPDNGIYYLTELNNLPEIIIYKGTVDFADKLEYVNTAMLSMKSAAYVLVELQRHKETADLYAEIHKWQGYQKQHDGLVAHVAYFDQETGIIKTGFIKNLVDYSSLRLLGYHVGDGFPENHRRNILMNCFSFDLISRKQAISHIEYLIEFGEKTKNAKEQWKSDLKFAKDYKNNIQLPAYNYLNVRREKWNNNSDELKKQFIQEHFG